MNFHLCVLDLSLAAIEVIEACAGFHPAATLVSRQYDDAVRGLDRRGFISVLGEGESDGRFVVGLSPGNLLAIESASDSAIASRPGWPLMEPED